MLRKKGRFKGLRKTIDTRTDVQKVVEDFDKRWKKAGDCIEKYTKGISVYIGKLESKRSFQNTFVSLLSQNGHYFLHESRITSRK